MCVHVCSVCPFFSSCVSLTLISIPESPITIDERTVSSISSKLKFAIIFNNDSEQQKGRSGRWMEEEDRSIRREQKSSHRLSLFSLTSVHSAVIINIIMPRNMPEFASRCEALNQVAV